MITFLQTGPQLGQGLQCMTWGGHISTLWKNSPHTTKEREGCEEVTLETLAYDRSDHEVMAKGSKYQGGHGRK